MKLNPEEEKRAHAYAVEELKKAKKEMGPMEAMPPELIALYLDELTARATKRVKARLKNEETP